MKVRFLSLLVSLSFILMPIILGCNDVNDTLPFLSDKGIELTAPTIVSYSPSDGATDVPINTLIIVSFSEEMDECSFSIDTFKIKDDGGHIIYGKLNINDNIIIFTPSSDLDEDTLYSIEMKEGLKDLAGNSIEAGIKWSFTTGSEKDTTPPVAKFRIPEDGATDVGTNAYILAIFDDELDATTINSDTFMVENAFNTPVDGTIVYNNRTAIFTPNDTLDSMSEYSVLITKDVRNVSGYNMDYDCKWNFTTGTLDTTSPYVESTDPVDAATNISPDTTVSAIFNENIDHASINTLTFIVREGANSIEGSLIYNYEEKKATFTPYSILGDEKTYTVTLTSDITDIAGNPMDSDYEWSFTTGDTTPPTVVSTNPMDGATDIPIDISISVTFSESMNESSISTDTIYIENIDGEVTYDDDTKTATLIPAGSLDYDTEYTVIVKGGENGVKDASSYNNAMEEDYEWTFETELSPFIGIYAYLINLKGDDIIGYDLNQDTGNLTWLDVEDTGDEPISAAVDPLGRFLYVANNNDETVSSFSIDQDNGHLSAISEDVGTGQEPYAVVVDPSGRFTYVANYLDNDIRIYTIDQDNGTLSAGSDVATGNNPVSIAVDPLGRFAYVVNQGDDNIRMYTINQGSGELTRIGDDDVITGNDPSAITVDPTGNFAYVINQGDDDIRMYTINQDSGELTRIGDDDVITGDDPSAITVDPTGSFVYIASYGDDSILVYETDEFGFLSFVEEETDGTVSNPRSLAVDETGSFLLVANYGWVNYLGYRYDDSIAVYSIDKDTGMLAHIETITDNIRAAQSVCVINISN